MKPWRQSTEQEIEALESVCERLAGFGTHVALEWVDGFMTALLAGPRIVLPSEWLPAMFGEDFGRAFADPTDVQLAMAALMARWNVLADQLDPESLLEAPDEMRLGPLMFEYDDEIRREIVEAGQVSAEEAADFVNTGALWCDGFRAAIEAFDSDWPEPDMATNDGRWYDDCLMRVFVLSLSGAELESHCAESYPGEAVEREQLIDDACFGVQDLRLYWLDHAPRPATRRVAPTPGRNDPCPCGSGKKYKKCHGSSLQ